MDSQPDIQLRDSQPELGLDSRPEIQGRGSRPDIRLRESSPGLLLGDAGVPALEGAVLAADLLNTDVLGSEALRRWELFRADENSYWRFARRLLRDVNDADDLVQEVALRILRHPTGPRDASCFRAWCYGVLRNAAMDFKRAAARRCRGDHVGLDQLDVAADAPTTDPEVDMEVRRLMDLTGTLDRRERELLLRRYVLEQTAAEIASDVGSTPAAIRMKLKRLLAKLRGVLLALNA